MRVGVITDGMLLKRRDDIGSMPPFQSARLLADQLKRGADSLLSEERRQPFRRVIAGRQDLILGVEPENNINLGGR